MGCGGCSKRRKARDKANNPNTYDVMGGYGNLPQRQLVARLETYKKIHCKECDRRYQCDFGTYSECTDRIK